MGGSRSCLDEQLSHVLPGCAGGRLAPKSLSDARVVRFPNRFPRNEGERPSKREEWKQEEDRCYYRWIRVGLKIPKQHGPKEQQNENSDSGIAGRAVHNADHDKDRSRKRPALLQYAATRSTALMTVGGPISPVERSCISLDEDSNCPEDLSTGRVHRLPLGRLITFPKK